MTQTIKFKILALLTIILLFGGVILGSSQYFNDLQAIEAEKKSSFLRFEQVYHSSLLAQVSKLKMAVELILNDPKTIQNFEEKNREDLANSLVTLFSKRLKPEFGVYQFQFHLPPATSFLRVHKPAKFGDDLSAFRKTVVQTNQSQSPTIGIEVGRAGPGVRVVYPIANEGKHLGSVELGGSLFEALAIASKIAEVDYSIGIKTQVFASAKRFAMKEKDIEYQDMLLYYFSSEAANSVSKKLKSTSGQDEISVNGKSWALGSIEIKDYSGKVVGKVFLFKDITANYAQLTKVLLLQGMIIILA
ncbi:MAG: cache domain-containing protein, partial [SAR324 cluster bacterium]|nr:cache domain-containing protein [SAR324 cluster bacterium]